MAIQRQRGRLPQSRPAVKINPQTTYDRPVKDADPRRVDTNDLTYRSYSGNVGINPQVSTRDLDVAPELHDRAEPGDWRVTQDTPVSKFWPRWINTQWLVNGAFAGLILYAVAGPAITRWWKSDKPVDPIVNPDEPVTPDVKLDNHAAMAAASLLRLYSSDWQAKTEIMKQAGKQQFENDQARSEWINKEFTERFNSAADPFLEELAEVMAGKLEADMGEIMSSSKVTFDLDSNIKKIESAAKKIKKK